MKIVYLSRNPLKSGQGFNPKELLTKAKSRCRNPLKSGQGFNMKVIEQRKEIYGECRNPLKSGQGFNFIRCSANGW